jgi:CubicO group peptidase (beta-lactamase class C family)
MPGAFDDDPAKRAITLHHVLTMRSGILFDNDNFTTEMIRQRHTDQARYILAKPLYNAPGVEFYYRDADPQLLSSAVEAVTGRSLAAIAAERLFGPLGITDHVWEANVDGSSFGPFGLFLKPRDLLKIGQLALQNGQWEGEHLVPADWIALATDVHTSTTYPDLFYGYYWWIVPELDTYSAWGRGGQFVLVVPADQLVILMTSLPSADDDVGTMLPRFLPIARRVVGAIIR